MFNLISISMAVIVFLVALVGALALFREGLKTCNLIEKVFVTVGVCLICAALSFCTFGFVQSIGVTVLSNPSISDCTKIAKVSISENNESNMLTFTSSEDTYSVFDKKTCKTYSVQDNLCEFQKDVKPGEEYVEVYERNQKLILEQDPPKLFIVHLSE